jgi:hypothetical protein
MVFLYAVMFISAGQLFAQNKDTKESTGPEYTGYIRFWQQSDFSTDQSQFILKEITMGASGTVNEYFGYKFLADLTRLGKLTTSTASINGTTVVTKASASFTDILLDAMIKVTPIANLSVSGGQFKIPFSTDNLRGNNSIDFVNRPLMTNVAPASRDVGAMVSYKASTLLPEISAGVFNGTGINKTENDKTINYVCRAVVTPLANLNFAANYYAGRISALDVKAYGVGFDWKYNNLFVDGEYIARDTKEPGHTIGSNSYFIYSLYNITISETGFLKYITPAVRFDSYDPDKDKNDNEVQRFTFGVTFNSAKISWAHIRLNYEMYDYKDATVNPDKLIAELQVRF